MALHPAVDQEGCIQQRRGRACLDEKLMIPRYNDLGGMGKLPQPSIEIRCCRRSLTEECEITGVDQYVAGWNFDLAMKLVCVGDTNDSYCFARVPRIRFQAILPSVAVDFPIQRSQEEHPCHAETILSL